MLENFDVWVKVPRTATTGASAALLGVCKRVIGRHGFEPHGPVLEEAFLAQHTHGMPAFIAYAEQVSWEDIERASGVTRAEIVAAADVYINARNVIGIYGMGLTQRVHGSQAIGRLVNLLLLRGNIGRPGAGC